MRMKTTAILHASERRISKKTQQAYTIGLFLEGVSSCKLMFPEGLPTLPNGEYDLELEYDEQYKNLKILTMVQTIPKK